MAPTVSAAPIFFLYDSWDRAINKRGGSVKPLMVEVDMSTVPCLCSGDL
jgi:hypothetical protein